MKRIALLVAVISLVVLGFGFGVNAQSSRPSTASSADLRQQTTPVGKHVMRELRRIRSLAPSVKLCKQVKPTSDVDKLIDCLNKVTEFAEHTQKQLDELDTFVNDFFKCTSYSQVTQYGDPLGSHGYVYDPGTGVTFKITALDFTVDLATDPFLNFYVLKPTDKCVQFAQ